MTGRLGRGIWGTVSMAFFLWGCGGAGTGSISDTTPPTVSFTSPARASTGVAVNTAIGVVFSEPMDVATIDQAGITLTDLSSEVAGAVNFSGTMATFTPSTRLAYNTTYTATIAARMKDVSGNALTADYSWNFTTGPAPDTTVPTVSLTSPAHNATGAAVNGALSAAFSEPMDPVTLTAATFTLTGPAGAVLGTVNASGTAATLTPLAGLAYDTTYTATITAAVNDLAGNALEADYTWSFTTGQAPDTTAPTVSLTTPSNNTTGLPTNSAIGVAFSEVMDPGTLTTATFTLTGPTGAVVGTVNANGTSATFSPLASLAYNTAYTATLTTGAKDLAGNPIAADYLWSFTTGPAPDTTAPTVSFTMPPNNATEIPIDSVIGAVFSEAMDLSTLTTATFTLIGPAGAVSGPVAASGRVAAFIPLVFLAYNTTYTATITLARDLAGNSIAETYTWSFTTRAVPDTVLGPASPSFGLTEMLQQVTEGFLLSCLNCSPHSLPAVVETVVYSIDWPAAPDPLAVSHPPTGGTFTVVP
ncbi:MAG: Ig-like domain-containing protein [Nitrospirae bacterium]|nr:Ig-like domain-containing protein [Nitrospirota bacterium]